MRGERGGKEKQEANRTAEGKKKKGRNIMDEQVMKNRTEVLKSRLVSYDKTVASLSKELKLHVSNHIAAAKKNKGFGETLGTVGRLEYYSGMKDALSCVGDGFKSIADSRISLLGNKGSNGGEMLLKRLSDSRQGVVVPMKELLSDRGNVVSLCAKEEKKLASLKSKAAKQAEKQKKSEGGSEDAIKAAGEAASDLLEVSQSLLDARDQLSNTDQRVDENLSHFEEKRMVDMKIFLEDFLRKEIQWHCQAIEIMTPIISKIRSVEPEGAVAELKERLDRIRGGFGGEDREGEQQAAEEVESEMGEKIGDERKENSTEGSSESSEPKQNDYPAIDEEN